MLRSMLNYKIPMSKHMLISITKIQTINKLPTKYRNIINSIENYADFYSKYIKPIVYFQHNIVTRVKKTKITDQMSKYYEFYLEL